MAKNLKEIGKLGKTFGFDGSLKLAIDSALLTELKKAEFVFIPTAGHKVPYFVDKIKTGKPLTIKLEDVNSKEDALSLSGQKIYIQAEVKATSGPVQLKEITQLSDLVAFELEDEKIGKIGKIAAIYELPQQWMASVDYEDREVLIPLNKEFVVAIDIAQKIVLTDLPEGLLVL